MKEFEIEAIERLIVFYSNFYSKGSVDEMRQQALDIYNNLTPANSMLHEYINVSVSRIFSIAYPGIDVDRTIPSKEEVKKILHELRKNLRELEK